ncbi:hypothetical protein [Streptomyces sp. NPDC058045]|uniref:hypothetical protein n=1 Tax=Streptomyces sp. NPDC058045 TaxID=3346311 RepID=UPI0036EC790A
MSETSEEVQRVAEAIAAIEQIEDIEERVRAKSKVMAAQVERNKEWSKERTRLIQDLWADGNGLSYRQIADRLQIKVSLVQDAFRGHKGTRTSKSSGKVSRPEKSSEASSEQ